MTKNTNLKDKEIRNIKDRERYKNNEESRNKTIYRRGKSATFKFLEIASIEHLKEIEKIVKQKLEKIK